MPKVKSCKNNKIFLIVASLSIFINIILGVFTYSLYLKKEADIDVLETYVLPALLENYRDATFLSTESPLKSPFGGNGMEYTRVTSGYKDPTYTRQFGEVHNAIDIVPSDQYSQNNIAYLVSKRPIVFATHSGSVDYLFDEYGANYLVITNASETLRTLYVHLKASYIQGGSQVVAGQPIGVMGTTGKSTGEHLHYAVQTKDRNGNWVYVNPMDYIK